MVKPMRGVDGYNPWTPGDTVLDYGSTQGFAAAMAVALG